MKVLSQFSHSIFFRICEHCESLCCKTPVLNIVIFMFRGTRMNTLGMHLVCELNGCNPSILTKVPAIKHAMEAAAISANATILDGYFHQFSPTGVSGLLCLAESHVSIHTWPESG